MKKLINKIENKKRELDLKNKQSNFIKRRDSIIHTLFVGLTTQETLMLLGQVNAISKSDIETRLSEIKTEKECIERYYKMK